MCQFDWAMIKYYFWLCLWECFWMKLAFRSADSVKSIVFPNVCGHHPIVKGLIRTKRMCPHKPNPSQFWSVGSPRTQHQIRCLVRACFFIESCLLTVPSCCRRARELYGAFFIRALIPILRAAYSPSPKASPPNNITLGIGFQHMNFGGEWAHSFRL